MAYRVGYFMRANEGVYSVLRAQLPAGVELVTLGSQDEPAQLIRDLDFLIAGKVTRAMLDAAPRLRLIMAPGIGTDGIDLSAAAEKAIPVSITVPGNVTEVAEHTRLLMLAVCRRLIELDRGLRQGRWMMWERRLESFNLSGRTLGLVGMGRIGQAVAKRAAGFDMRIQYHDPVRAAGFPYAPLDELLGASDFVSLHVPLTSQTARLLNAERIRLMKPTAVLINTSRGEVVEETALVAALKAGRLAGAGLDVFIQEPLPADHPLLSLDNVVLTPHAASGTLDGLRAKAAVYAANIRRVLAGQPPEPCVQARAETA